MSEITMPDTVRGTAPPVISGDATAGRPGVMFPIRLWGERSAAAQPAAPGRSVEALIGIHASNRSLPAVAVDLVVLALVALAVGVVPTWVCGAWAAAVVGTGYLGRLYGDRDTIKSRGFLWYPGKPVVPVGLVAFAGVSTDLLRLHAVILLVPAAIVALSGVRLVAWLVLAWLRHTGSALRPALVVGSGPTAQTVSRKLAEFPEGGLRPVATVPIEALETDGALEQQIRRWRAQHVVVVPTHANEAYLTAHLRRGRGLDTRFSIVPPLADLFLHPGRVTELGGVPFLSVGRLLRGRSTFPGKRPFDVLVALLLLLAVSPVLAVAAIAVKLGDGGPVLFRQRRVGKAGHVFGMLKFRSMVVGADLMQGELVDYNVSDGLLFRMADDPRITPIGRILRRWSIDELPQLWNVVRGDMSLVGPRPLPVDPGAFDVVDSERHGVLPGITGYWQISGGNGLSYEEMIKLDLAYIRNWSLWLDVRLLARTLPVLVHRHDPC